MKMRPVVASSIALDLGQAGTRMRAFAPFGLIQINVAFAWRFHHGRTPKRPSKDTS